MSEWIVRYVVGFAGGHCYAPWQEKVNVLICAVLLFRLVSISSSTSSSSLVLVTGESTTVH